MKINYLNNGDLEVTFPKTENRNEMVVVMTISEANEIAEAVNLSYYKQDIETYFKESLSFDEVAVLADTELIDKILDEYAEYRKNADGGEYEDSMHWSECLRLAISQFSEELKRYQII